MTTMFTEAKWLEALRLPLKANIAIALASNALLALSWTIDLDKISTAAPTVVTVVSVVFSIFAVVGIVDVCLAPLRARRRQSNLKLRRSIRRREKEEEIKAQNERTIAELDYLSREEIRVLADAIRGGSPSFLTYSASPPVSLLRGKGLVWTPGGSHHREYYPFSFHSFAWQKILERKDEFITRDEEYKRAEKAETERQIRY